MPNRNNSRFESTCPLTGFEIICWAPLLYPHVTKSLRPFPSLFAFCNRDWRWGTCLISHQTIWLHYIKPLDDTLKSTQPMLNSVSGSSLAHCSTRVCMKQHTMVTKSKTHRRKDLITLAFGRSSSAYLMAAWSFTTYASRYGHHTVTKYSSIKYILLIQCMHILHIPQADRPGSQSDRRPSLPQGRSRPYRDTVDMCMWGRVGMKQRNKGGGGGGRKERMKRREHTNTVQNNKRLGGSSAMGAHSRSLEHAKVPILGYSVQRVSLRLGMRIFSGGSDVPVHSKLCSRPRLDVTAPAAHSCKQ